MKPRSRDARKVDPRGNGLEVELEALALPLGELAARDLLVRPTNIYANQPERDDQQRGATKLEVAFSLPRGVYATMLMKHLFAGIAALAPGTKGGNLAPRTTHHD